MNSRAKGARGERDLAKKLRELGYETAERDGQQGNGNAKDHPDVKGVEGMHIECKRTERLNVYDAVDQAKDDSAENEVPVVMWRKNDHKWLAILELERFIEIWKEAKA